MSTTQVSILAFASLVILSTTAIAQDRGYQQGYSRYQYAPRADTYASPRGYGAFSSRGGSPIVTQPNGTYIGTDPDPSIRTYMNHDNIGPNGAFGGGPGN